MSEDDLNAVEDRLAHLTSRQRLPYAYLTLAADARALLAEVRRLRASLPAFPSPPVADPPFDVTGYDDGFVTPPAAPDANDEPCDGFARPYFVEGAD